MKKPYISLIHKVFTLYFCLFLKASRAENGTRTRDLNLGKVALYQLSYFRIIFSGTGGGYFPVPTSFPGPGTCVSGLQI